MNHAELHTTGWFPAHDDRFPSSIWRFRLVDELNGAPPPSGFELGLLGPKPSPVFVVLFSGAGIMPRTQAKKNVPASLKSGENQAFPGGRFSMMVCCRIRVPSSTM